MYADDLIVIALDLTQVRRSLNTVKRISSQLELKLNYTKSGIMPLNKKRG